MSQRKDDREQQRLWAIALIERMEPKLIRILRKWTSDMYLIEDVMLDTWEIMLKNMHTVENHPNPEGWIIKAAKYNMWKALKKQQNQWKKETDILEILDSYAADIAEQDEHFYDMYKEVLSQEEMELLKFIYVYEVDYETTSKYLGIKPSACRKRAERIRKKLKKYYKNDKMDQ